MFSPYSNENLIEENTLQIAEKVLYSFGDAENKSVIKPIKHENKKSAFANFAKISAIDEMPIWGNNTADSVMNNYYKSPNFQGVSLYKPLGVIADNPLERGIYSYSMSSATAVKGMAFANKSGGIVKNPLATQCNIVDNSYEFNRTIKNNDVYDIINAAKTEKNMPIIDATRVEIAPIAHNTFQMADILIETQTSQIIEFMPQKTMALTKTTKMSSFWAKQRAMIDNLKNMFSIKKEKVK